MSNCQNCHHVKGLHVEKGTGPCVNVDYDHVTYPVKPEKPKPCMCEAFAPAAVREATCQTDHVNGPVDYTVCAQCEDTYPVCRDCGEDVWGHLPCDEEPPAPSGQLTATDRHGPTTQTATAAVPEATDECDHINGWHQFPGSTIWKCLKCGAVLHDDALRAENAEFRAAWSHDVSTLESLVINDEAAFRRLRKAFEDKDAEALELRVRYEHVERENQALREQLDRAGLAHKAGEDE